ncbi:hypothetical protein ANN_25648 [Periplaneta americana]|uniref:MADF domain-containing protein n=1 Tax=Periplaneta americana TaxID=6978 RepID=A0ABQ8S4H6_PERAM|nr:hypothetical protein ANN_25648 [Periplaneta americana]
MAGLREGGNEPPGSLKAKDRDITYALFCSVLCIMEQVLFDEILILSVEENPHVYDKRRASYKDEKMKKNTWLSIAASLNTDQGLLLVDIMPHGTTINSDGYVATLKKLQVRLSRVRRHREKQDVLLLHDNAQPCQSQDHRPDQKIRIDNTETLALQS